MKYILTLLAVLFSSLLSVPTQAKQNPYDIIDESAQKVMAAIEDTRKDKQSTDKLSEELEVILNPIVDFEGIARAVMSKHNKVASDEQRARFVPVFKDGLAELYAKTLVQFKIDNIAVEHPEDSDTEFPGNVKMLVDTANGDSYEIIYTMRPNKKTGDWEIKNVTLDGINLGLTYRNQFDSAMNTYGSVDEVIDNWVRALEDDELEDLE